MSENSLQVKLDAALHVAVFGVEQSGVATKRSLMQPFELYSDNDVKKVAVNLLGNALTVLLSAQPPAVSELIAIRQAGYLSFVCGDGSLDGIDLKPVIESHHPD